MGETPNVAPHRHSHVFLGEGHEKSERKTWAVIWLCGAMMLAEIGGGLMFGSIALVAVPSGLAPSRPGQRGLAWL